MCCEICLIVLVIEEIVLDNYVVGDFTHLLGNSSQQAAISVTDGRMPVGRPLHKQQVHNKHVSRTDKRLN